MLFDLYIVAIGQLLPLLVERRARLNARVDLGALNAGQARIYGCTRMNGIEAFTLQGF
jgi:hypothetical protein